MITRDMLGDEPGAWQWDGEKWVKFFPVSENDEWVHFVEAWVGGGPKPFKTLPPESKSGPSGEEQPS